MRGRIHFKLTRDQFIVAVGGTEPLLWYQACGPLSKTSFMSDQKKIGISFVVNSCYESHNHSTCVRCQTKLTDPGRALLCDTQPQPMLQSCCLRLSIPWNTNTQFKFYVEETMNPSEPVPEFVYHDSSSDDSSSDNSLP